MTRRLAPVALLALLGAPAFARAEEPPPPVVFRLEYTRGPRTVCPDEHALAELLHRGLAYEARADAELRLVIAATREGGVHRVVMALRDGAGKELWGRDYRYTRCADAVEASVNSAALEFVQPEPVVVPLEIVPPPLPVMIAVVPPSAVPAVPSPAAPFEVYLGADLLLGLGSTPSPTLGPGAFVTVRPAHVALSLEVTARAGWTIVPALVSDAQHVAVSSNFYAGQLALCGHLGFGFFCPVLGLGEIEHHGATFAIAPTSAFAIVGARVGAQRRFADFLVRGFVEFEAMPGGGVKFALYDNERWRPSVGGIVGVGVALPTPIGK